MDIRDQVEEVLDKIRPFLNRDGGDISFYHFDETRGIVYVKMHGACNGCHLANEDISNGAEIIICEEVPGVSQVVLVTPEVEEYLKENGIAIREEA